MGGYGALGHIKWAFQNSFGAANVASYYSLPVISENMAETINQLEPDTLQGRFERGQNNEGTHEVGGDIVMEGHPIYMGCLLKGWFGQSSGTLTGSVTAHSFKPVAADFDQYAAVPPVTLECFRDAGSAHQYYDCLVNELTIDIAQGDVAKITASMIGGKFTKVEKTTASYLAGSSFTWDQASVSLGGSITADIADLSVKLSNNLEAKHTLSGAKTPSRIKRTDFRGCEVSGTFVFKNDTEFDNFRNQALQRLFIYLRGQAISSGYYAGLSIDVPSLRYTEFPISRESAGEIEVGFSGKAEYNSGSATMIEITLTNTQAAY